MRELERRFAHELVIIGVHSAKYTVEGQDAHLRQAVQRLELDHPVVNDHDMRIWQEYGVRAWPTLMFVGPDGKVIGKHEGEFPLEPMVEIVEGMLAEFEANGLLSRDSFVLGVVPDAPDSFLAYPSAVQAAADGTLYIADTNHNRFVICDGDGLVQRVIGSGTAGLLDGAAEQAAFHHPHGLALDDGVLYVADTGNHVVRSIDLKTGVVSTLAGTGRKALSYGSGGPALETDLSSPWDVAVHNNVLYIAMAGNHQLWLHELGSNEVRRYAGTGHEGKRDGRVAAAWLAQPSAVAYADGRLTFTDAETSSVRTCDILSTENGQVATVAGKDLFDWGDVDGPLDGALLQHAAGVAGDGELLYVADTYNNKIKRIDLVRREITTLAGDGAAGDADGDGASARFFEPHGLALTADMLYVADTNNHLIRRVDLAIGAVTSVDVRA